MKLNTRKNKYVQHHGESYDAAPAFKALEYIPISSEDVLINQSLGNSCSYNEDGSEQAEKACKRIIDLKIMNLALFGDDFVHKKGLQNSSEITDIKFPYKLSEVEGSVSSSSIIRTCSVLNKYGYDPNLMVMPTKQYDILASSTVITKSYDEFPSILYIQQHFPNLNIIDDKYVNVTMLGQFDVKNFFISIPERFNCFKIGKFKGHNETVKMFRTLTGGLCIKKPNSIVRMVWKNED